MNRKRRVHFAVRPGSMIGMIMAVLCACFGIIFSEKKLPEVMDMPISLPTPGRAMHVSETGNVLLSDCEIIQTMGFLRCGHSVTRRIHPPKDITGADFSAVQQYYDLWQIESFSPSHVKMSREISLYCPMHSVLGTNEAGEIVLSKNYYGDGMAVERMYSRNIAEFDEETQEALALGIGFDSREEAEAWLAAH